MRCSDVPGVRFQTASDVSGQTSVKSSVQRNIRAGILAQWAIDPETFEQIWPKKEAIILVKWSVVASLPVPVFCPILLSAVNP